MSVSQALRYDPDQRNITYGQIRELVYGERNGAKPRIDDSRNGMMYGQEEYDRGHPHPRPVRNPFNEKSEVELDKIRRQQVEMDDDIRMMKERQMRERQDREDEKRQIYDMMNKSYPWDKQNKGHGAPRGSGHNRRRKFLETDLSPRNQPGYKSKKESDLFLDVLGGPDGKQLRENGGPGLTDQRFERQQQQYNSGRGNAEPQLKQHEQRMEDLRKQIDHLKHQSGMDDEHNNDSYSRDFARGPPMPEPQRTPKRSLDLENTRGGAGAPVKDDRGKAVTRRPITLTRNDYGDSKIKEDIPGKPDINYLLEEDNRPYYPWGSQGGGAPIRDREGNVKTQIYGKLEGRDANFVGAESHRAGSGEVRRYKRRQEVLYNELKEGVRQQQENKEEQTRFMKAPHGDLAEVIRAGRVGKPRRNEITGEIAQHHLGNSDVSKLKMNHQPKPADQKKTYHDELLRAAEERQHLKQLEKLKEKQESNAHFNNMDGMWGMFGGGAPKDPSVRKKANLFNSIHNPDYSPSPRNHDHTLPLTGLGNFERVTNASYRKLYLDDNLQRHHASPDNSPRYVKTTTNSTHKNMFDAPDNPRGLVGSNAQSLAPYATGGVY